MSEQRNDSVPVTKLKELLGFDPLKGGVSSVLSTAVDEIKKEREEKALAKTKELLVQAITLAEKIATLRRDCNKEIAKSEKQLGDIMKKINSQVQGAPENTEETEESPPSN